MSADLGLTEIYEPLKDILEEKIEENIIDKFSDLIDSMLSLKKKQKTVYPKHVFLLTDGGVSNTSGVLSLIK